MDRKQAIETLQYAMEQIAEAAMLLRRVAELTEDKSAINYIVAPLEIMVETGG